MPAMDARLPATVPIHVPNVAHKASGIGLRTLLIRRRPGLARVFDAGPHGPDAPDRPCARTRRARAHHPAIC